MIALQPSLSVPKLESKIETAKAEADEARRRVDAVLDVGNVDADQTLRSDWFPTITGLIMAVTDLRQELEVGLASSFGVEVGAAVTVRDSLAIWAEFAGRERGMLAGIVSSGMPISPETLARLENYRGRIVAAIERAQLLEAYLPSELRSQIDRAADIFYGPFSGLRTAILEASATGTPYPVDGSQWFGEATKSIAAALQAATAVRTYAESALNSHIDGMRLNFMINIGIVVFSLIVLIGVGWWIARSVIHPLSRLTAAINEIAVGNLDVFIPEVDRKDELGDLGRGLYKAKQEMRAAEQYRSEQEEYRLRVMQEQRAQTLSLADQFEGEVGSIGRSIASAASELAATSNEVQGLSGKAAASSSRVQSDAEQASQSIELVSQAASELNNAIAEVTRKVSESADLAKTASVRASDAAGQVSELNESSELIREVIKVISDIAEQTNLLALNATIEAARAGDAGKGFAVVASEVKSLANQTAQATDEIATQITEMLDKISTSTAAVQEIVGSVDETSETMVSITSAAEEQSAATQDIAGQVENAAELLRSVAESAIGAAEGAANASAATQQVSSASSELAKNAETLNSATDRFLAEIREEKKVA